MNLKEIEVVAAVIEVEGEILCVQRGDSKLDYISRKWEFPGGKIEAGETDQEALRREIREELELSVIVKNRLLTVVHDYPDFRLIMHCYFCVGECSNLTLTEHLGFVWRSKTNLRDLDWAAADIPIVEHLEGML